MIENPIYFYARFTNTIVFGGGALLFIRLTDVLHNKGRKVFIFVLEEAAMFKYIKSNYPHINCIPLPSNETPIKLLDNSIVVSPVPILHKLEGENIRLFKWCIDQLNEIKFKYNTTKANYNIDDFIKYYNKKKSLLYIDPISFKVHCKRKPNKKEKSLIVKLPLEEVNFECNRNLVSDSEINIAWLGRLDNWKMPSVLAILENFNNYKSTKRKIIHIIGSGKDENLIKPEIYPNIEIIMCGKMYGDDLYNYMCSKIDVLVAMGTSLLEGAILKLPVLYVPFMQSYFNFDHAEGSKKFIKIKDFLWIYADDLVFSAETISMSKHKTSLTKALDDIYIYNKKTEIGDLSYKLFKQNYTMEKTVRDFLYNIDNPKSGVLYEDHIKLLNSFKLRFVDIIIFNMYKILFKWYKDLSQYLLDKKVIRITLKEEYHLILINNYKTGRSELNRHILTKLNKSFADKVLYKAYRIVFKYYRLIAKYLLDKKIIKQYLLY